MNVGELVRMETGNALAIPEAVAAEMQQMREALQTMAGLLRTTNETMAQLQRQVRLLEKVTPAQAGAINKAIRERAAALCRVYAARDYEKAVAAAIRKAIKLRFGANAAKELPRCEYEVAMAQVNGWDDYKTMKEIKGRKNNGTR
ncbi:MAG: ORF6C domain-containing protein [Succinivibrionaceae bacterium]|nr:ORF6C domain-containing protein [Succinivibrionaceae bacterium]MBQ8708155.1 ORF6C domain-containing protein [Succinivibrionaceae bacterium]